MTTKTGISRFTAPGDSSEYQAKLEWVHGRLLEDGLVPVDFSPQGETSKDKIQSLRARSTCEFYRRNPNHYDDPLKPARYLWGPQPDGYPPPNCHYNPDQLVSMNEFNTKARESGFTPISDVVAETFPNLRDLPKGDAWEGD